MVPWGKNRRNEPRQNITTHCRAELSDDGTKSGSVRYLMAGQAWYSGVEDWYLLVECLYLGVPSRKLRLRPTQVVLHMSTAWHVESLSTLRSTSSIDAVPKVGSISRSAWVLLVI